MRPSAWPVGTKPTRYGVRIARRQRERSMSFFSSLMGSSPGGGVRGAIGTALRSLGSGYETITSAASEEAETAMQVPLEGVVAGTMTLRDATANVPVVGTATKLLDKVAGVAMLASTANLVDGYARPGRSISSVAHKAADLLDGQNSTADWSEGYSQAQGIDGARLLRASDTGEFLASLGIR